MFDKFKFNKNYLNIGIITLIIGSILLFVYQVSRHSVDIFFFVKNILFTFLSIISPIIYAFVLAYILYRPLRFIERLVHILWIKITNQKLSHKTTRLISLLTLVILIFGFITFLTKLLIPPLFQNLLTIGEALPNFQTILTDWLSKISPYFESIYISETQIQKLAVYITNFLSQFLTTIFDSRSGVITNVASFFIHLVATIILTFYFLKDREAILKTIDNVSMILLSSKLRQRIKYFLKDLHEVFGNFILGQLLDALIVGIASTTLLLIIGHPFALLIGVIAGITNVIPYIGPIIGAALALILGIFTNVKLGILGCVLLIIYQQIDGNIIQPKILGDSVGLAPVWIFIAILVGGSYLGAVGMIISVPLVALMKRYFDRLFMKHQLTNEKISK
ncbi:MAG TPA: AI-2E family transporter [Candidatus Atopostipes pullistercoris]|uniref:AI-2E family transporter n=1 Tax=Candidatus Atopostipes pullistercoris TaxID=2838467 RepID=A0A9D2G2D2_9LACT|nr:AI-2E family transporter [Candidatus Atopostipes pullistercoris]